MNVQNLLQNPPKLHTDEFGQPISWGLSDDVLYFLDKHVSNTFRTLETGAGLSTILFGLIGSQHTCIVPSKDQVDRIKDYCAQHNIPIQNISFEIDTSENVLPRLEINDLDLVLIDGRHGFPTPFLDWYYASPKLKVGGTLIVDDTQIWTGRVLKEFLLLEPEWRLEEEFSNKTAVFKKLKEGSHSKEWNNQPYVFHRST
jgi:predicted O-methyltransferase YrrM